MHCLLYTFYSPIFSLGTSHTCKVVPPPLTIRLWLDHLRQLLKPALNGHMATSVTSYSFSVSLIQTHSLEKHKAVYLICSVCIHTRTHTQLIFDTPQTLMVSLSVWDTLFTHIPHCRAPHAHNSDVFSISLSRVCARTHTLSELQMPHLGRGAGPPQGSPPRACLS